jgi:hypothetical protein
LTNRREAILNGTAPAWENHISSFPEKIPPTFAAEFRRFRNIASGHVKVVRPCLSLTDFYDRNHKFLYMLYHDVQSWWGRLGDEFPDLEEITAFSVLIKDDPPRGADACDNPPSTGSGVATAKSSRLGGQGLGFPK